MIFKPHDYQSYCIDYIRTHPIAALRLRHGPWKDRYHIDSNPGPDAGYL